MSESIFPRLMVLGGTIVLLTVLINICVHSSAIAKDTDSATRPATAASAATPSNSASGASSAKSITEPSPAKSNQSVVGSSVVSATGGGRVYSPVFLPSEVRLNDAQIESIKEAFTKQIGTYHDAMAQQNISSTNLYASQSQLWLAKSAHDKWSYEHTQGVFRRHALYTKIIFFMVISIVGSGLVLTWYQFIRDSSNVSKILQPILNNKSGDKLDQTTISALLDAFRAEQSLELSRDGMKIKTRVIGLMTLVISMGFFYLYLTHVYPVTIQDSIAKYQGSSPTGSGAATKPAAGGEPSKPEGK